MFITIIKNELAKRCDRNPSYSLRAFAKSLNIDASTLSRILNNKTIPSVELAKQIADGLALDPKTYHEFIGSVSSNHQYRDLKKISIKFHTTHEESKTSRELSIAAATAMADWYHPAILELTLTEGFRSDAFWIASHLNISVITAKLAIERLLELELLEEIDGVLRKTDNTLTIQDKHLTTSSLKRRQKQWVEMAATSLENDDISIRSHTSMTMAIDPKLIPEAKKMISEFNKQLCAFLEQGDRKQVYDLGIALFPLQKVGEENEK